MLTCRELVDRTDALLAGEIPWHGRLAVRIHVALCRYCRGYLRQYRLMLAILPKACDHASEEEVAAVLEQVRAGAKDAGR